MVLDCFDICSIIAASYSESFTFWNVQSSFCKTGLWTPIKLIASIDALEHLSYFETNIERQPSIKDFLQTFNVKRRSLLCFIDIEESGTVSIKTSGNAHLAASCVKSALERGEKRRVETIAASEQRLPLRDARAAYPETYLENARLLELAPCWRVYLVALNQTSEVRHERAAACTVAKATLWCCQSSPLPKCSAIVFPLSLSVFWCE